MTWLSQILSNRVRGRVIAATPDWIYCRRDCVPALAMTQQGASLRGMQRRSNLGKPLRLGFGRGAALAAVVVAAALGDARRLATAAAQIVELRPSYGAAADDLDRSDARRVQREDALDPFA